MSQEISNHDPVPSFGWIHQHDGRGVHTLTLAQPATFNVLSESVLRQMLDFIGKIQSDVDARVLVLAAQGKAFCAGYSLQEMAQRSRLDEYQSLFALCSKAMLAIRDLPMPVLAKVQGLATGAGCQLVAQCDFAIATEDASFGVNGIDVGLFCSTPSVALSRAVPGKQALHMLMTGDFINAHQALEWGLINQVVAPQRLDTAIQVCVDKLLSKPKAALALGKAMFYQQREMGLDAAYQVAGQAMAVNMMMPCAQEGVRAYVEQSRPSWRSE